MFVPARLREILSGHGHKKTREECPTKERQTAAKAVSVMSLRLNLDGLLERIWQASVPALMLLYDA